MSIELTDEQRQAVINGEALRLPVPAVGGDVVLLRAEELDRLTEYDAGPWTDEEMDLLAAEDADSLGWEGMDVYQDDAP
jgi:hypothetical protein